LATNEVTIIYTALVFFIFNRRKAVKAFTVGLEPTKFSGKESDKPIIEVTFTYTAYIFILLFCKFL
jgi:hypothetical protein